MNESSADVNLKDPSSFLNLDEFGRTKCTTLITTTVFRTIHHPLRREIFVCCHRTDLFELSVDDARIFLLDVIPTIKGDGSTVTFDCTGNITKN